MAAALVANSPAPAPALEPKLSAPPSPSPRALTHPSATGLEVRLAARASAVHTPTSGLAPSYLQANLMMLPSRYAADFRLLCARNPVPCPLLAESTAPGRWDAVSSRVGAQIIAAGSDFDVRRDTPRYNVYKDGALAVESADDVVNQWTDDHLAFLIGCSFSFEAALTAAGLAPRHAVLGRNVPMYRTSVPLCPAGVFTGGTYVVSMRPYRAAEVEAVRAITRGYNDTHGEPIAWGWDALAKLGIQDVDVPQWGDAPLTAEGGRPLGSCYGSDEEVPVFWGCGVTPQEAVMRAGIQGTAMSHAPGYMLLLDCTNDDVVSK